MADEFILKGTDFIKAAFVVALRAAYQAQTYFTIYKYNPDDTLTGLSIYESFPKRPLKVPAIIVMTTGGDISRSTLDSEDYLKETRTVPGEAPSDKFGWGRVDTTVQITILGLQDRDRRKLTDLTGLFCRHLFVDKFASFGIGYKSIKIGGEQEQEWQGQMLYTNTLTLPCYTEFQVKYPVSLTDVIARLDLSMTVESVDDEDETPT